MLKSIFLIVGSLISNRLISALLYNTARPMLRDLIRRSVKFTARVITVCLIGALTFAAGLVMTFVELGGQLTDVGALYFSPPLGFGLGLILIGVMFTYLGAYSNLLSPWRSLAKRDKKESIQEDSAFTHLIETLVEAMQERAEVRRHREHRRSGIPAPPTSYTPPPAHSQTDPRDYSAPVH